MLHFGKIPKDFGQIWRKFSKFQIINFWQNLRNFGKKQQKIQQFLTKILRLESGAKDLFPPMVFLVFWYSIPKRCKGVHCVDLGESFPTSIYLQNLASIEPRSNLISSWKSLLKNRLPNIFSKSIHNLITWDRSCFLHGSAGFFHARD